MTTPEQLAETVREALDGGLPLLYAEDRKARREKAEAALDSLLAAYEEMRHRSTVAWAAYEAEIRRERDKARRSFSAKEREVDSLKKLCDDYERLRNETADERDAAEREVERLREERDLANEKMRGHQESIRRRKHNAAEQEKLIQSLRAALGSESE